MKAKTIGAKCEYCGARFRRKRIGFGARKKTCNPRCRDALRKFMKKFRLCARG